MNFTSSHSTFGFILVIQLFSAGNILCAFFLNGIKKINISKRIVKNIIFSIKYFVKINGLWYLLYLLYITYKFVQVLRDFFYESKRNNKKNREKYFTLTNFVLFHPIMFSYRISIQRNWERNWRNKSNHECVFQLVAK